MKDPPTIPATWCQVLSAQAPARFNSLGWNERGDTLRIWDIPTTRLCRQHLLGEHLELHIAWNIITQDQQSYWSNHKETNRWRNKLAALWLRHEEQVGEMRRRGYNHKSPLDITLATGEVVQLEHIYPIDKQIETLRKRCEVCDERFNYGSVV